MIEKAHCLLSPTVWHPPHPHEHLYLTTGVFSSSSGYGTKLHLRVAQVDCQSNPVLTQCLYHFIHTRWVAAAWGILMHTNRTGRKLVHEIFYTSVPPSVCNIYNIIHTSQDGINNVPSVANTGKTLSGSPFVEYAECRTCHKCVLTYSRVRAG